MVSRRACWCRSPGAGRSGPSVRGRAHRSRPAGRVPAPGGRLGPRDGELDALVQRDPGFASAGRDPARGRRPRPALGLRFRSNRCLCARAAHDRPPFAEATHGCHATTCSAVRALPSRVEAPLWPGPATPRSRRGRSSNLRERSRARAAPSRATRHAGRSPPVEVALTRC